MYKRWLAVFAACSVLFPAATLAEGEGQKRWRRMNQMRQEQFDLVLRLIAILIPLVR